MKAYHMIGEYAVSVDMAQNEFRPFTPGPKDGQVGPWILFGHNYSNLNAILAKGRSLGLSVAPVPRPKPAQKASSKYMKHAEAGDILAPLGRILDALPVSHDCGVHTMANTVNAPATKYMARWGGLPKTFAPGENYALLAGVSQASSKYFALAPRRPNNLVPELHLGQRNVNPRLSRSLTSQRKMLPSIAPAAGRPGVMSTQQLTGHQSTAISSGERQDSISERSMAQKIGKQNLQVALNDLLNAQARLPPSGPTAFDPRLTPAWAGLKLPQ